MKNLSRIATRQKSDLLFTSDTVLSAGGSFISGAREVSGYNAITFLASSDQPFTISVQESCSCDGTFVQTQVLTATLVAGKYVVCEQVNPCGAFMKAVLTNTGGSPETFLDFCAQGLPQP